MKQHLNGALGVVAIAALVAACGSSTSSPTASGSSTTAPAAPAASTPAAPAPSDTTVGPPSGMPMPTVSVDASTAAADPQTAEAVVHIKGFMFSAPSKPIAAGVTFMVVNDDGVAHTYEDVDHAFRSDTIKAGASVEVKAPKAGSYQVKCDFHPSMHGTLTVA